MSFFFFWPREWQQHNYLHLFPRMSRSWLHSAPLPGDRQISWVWITFFHVPLPSSLSTFLLLDPSSSMISTFCVVLSLESSHSLPFEADFSFPMLKLDLLSSLPGSFPWALSLPADTVMYLHPSPLSPSLSICRVLTHIDILSVHPLCTSSLYFLSVLPLRTSLQISTFS